MTVSPDSANPDGLRRGVAHILEAGCGSGRDALYYARQDFAVTGLDVSATALRWARAEATKAGIPVSLVAADLLAAELPRASFDAVVAIHLLHLKPEPVRRTMVNRCWGLARDGGLIAMANYATDEAGFSTWDPYPERNSRVGPKGKLVHFFDAEGIASPFTPDRFDLLTSQLVDVTETPDAGPVSHREWLIIARKVRAC